MFSLRTKLPENPALFSKSATFLSKTCLDILEEIKTCIPVGVPSKQKNEFLKKCKETLLQNRKLTQKIIDDDFFRVKFIEDSDFRNEMTKDLDSPKQKSFKISDIKPSLSAVIKTFVFGSLLFSSGVASQSTYVVHNDIIPQNGTDLCPADLVSCTQGFITNGTMPWDTSMPQYQVNVVTFNHRFTSDTGPMLSQCMSGSKVGELVANAYGNGTSAILVDCPLSSFEWDNYEARGKATVIQQDACKQLQDQFYLEVEVCKKLKERSDSRENIILFSPLFGGIGCAALCALAYHAIKKRSVEKMNNPSVSI
jgi:hypothetical protein